MIDWNRMTCLRHEVGEAEFRPLVELFLDEIEGVIMGLLPLGADLGPRLHFIKGCALNMGLTAFCRTCETWESLLAAGRSGELQADMLMTSYSASKQVLMRDIDRMTLGEGARSGVA